MKEEGMAAGGVRRSQEGPESPKRFYLLWESKQQGRQLSTDGEVAGVPKEKA